jgi:glyoxylase-like metal-dependent hydrolase (beta-lactamase superfamily II)
MHTTDTQIQNNQIISGKWKFSFINDGNFHINPPGSGNKKNNFSGKISANLNTFNISYLLVETPSDAILIDLGIGSLPSRFFSRLDQYEHIPVKEKLKKITKKDISAIILSHMHIDHIGNHLEYVENIFKENFTNVPCYVSRKEWEFRSSRLKKADDTYKTYYSSIEKNLILTKEGQEIYPGVYIRYIGGHTPGHQTILICADEVKVFYAGDLIATEAQLLKNRSLPFDFDAEYAKVLRENILTEGFQNNWIFAMNHAPHVKFKFLEKAVKNL